MNGIESINAALLMFCPPAFGIIVQERGSRLFIGHCPPVCLLSVYQTSPHMTRSPRPSPSIFAYCKRSNTGSENGLGTRLLGWHCL